MNKVKTGVVKVVQVGYKLDETAHALPALRMALGYAFSCFFMIMAVASKLAHVQCMFVVATMVTLFVLEPIPYQCSCMLPLFLFPISRLLVAHKLFGVYMNDEILRSISSVLVGLIALKSPLSRRLCLWFLCVTGVRVGRVLLSVMLLVFLVSMLVDATMTTGILAGFVDPLIFEIYANNLRIRYAEHVRAGHKEADATLTEVDFVFKDPAKQRRVVAGEARMDDTVEEISQEAEPMFAVDTEGNVQQIAMVVDRDEGQGPADLEAQLAENPQRRREQVSEALRSYGIDLQKMGLKLELQDTTIDGKSASTNVSVTTDGENRSTDTHLSLVTQKSEPGGKSEGRRRESDRSKVNRKLQDNGKKSTGPKTKANQKHRASKKEDLTDNSRGSDGETSNSYRTPEGPHSPSDDDTAVGSKKLWQQRDGAKLATAVSGKRRPSKTHDGMLAKGSRGSRHPEEKDESTGDVSFSPKSHSIQETKSFSKNTSNAGSPQYQVHFSHVIHCAPPVATASTSTAADTGSAFSSRFVEERVSCFHFIEERQTECQQRRPVASYGMRRDSSISQWSTAAVIGTSTGSGEAIVTETHPSRPLCQTLEGPGVAETFFGVPDSKDFVLDFGGRLSGSQQHRSRRRKDALRAKRMLLRRKRKSTDLPREAARVEDEACVLPLADHNVHLGGDTGEKAGRPPLGKAWVDRVDETSRHNPLLATDVSFRLRRAWSKPGLVWQLSRFCAERGDSLRNLLFARHEQVAVAETARPDQSESGKPKKQRDARSLSEDNERSPKGESDRSPEKQHESSGQQSADPGGDDEDDQPGGHEGPADTSRFANAVGEGGHAQVNKTHKHGGRARELEAIIMEEKEKAKDLRAAVLLALTYGASFGAAAVYGASSANVYMKKYIEMNVKVPNVTLDVYMWLLVHVPFCLALMVIAARIIYYVHTRNYDITETATAPKSNVVIRDRLHIMGHVSYGEYIAAFLVGTAMVLLIFREPTFMSTGWGDWLGIEREVTDASVGIIVGMLAFLFPADILPEAHQTQIIEWADMLKRLPWGVIFILGSSSTISTAIENNGVYKVLEDKLFNLTMPPFYHHYISVLIMGCFGELTTFKSRLRHFTRIGYRISRKLHREPHLFLLPVSVVCQLSLILPSASPNNAMAFELGSMTSLQMCCSPRRLVGWLVGWSFLNEMAQPTLE
ncbi:uncharacterized protein [Dermacentor albipictus]|uniref:uncharacterized protein isoform X2 n=1 Tax=Dermacentor albipictus TaxID=60249 RepID=UPI0031FD2802